MSRIVVLEERCKGCLLCTEACPKKLLRRSVRFNRQGYQFVESVDADESLCIGCAACATMCPDLAIRVYRTRKVKKEGGEA